MSIVAETATLAHGFTMADVERAARIAAAQSMRLLSYEDRYETAWSGVVEYLYRATEKPLFRDLINSGLRATNLESLTHLQQHGKRSPTPREPGEWGANFDKYWRHVGEAPDFTDKIAERLALPQVLGQLSPMEYEVIAALAVHGNQQSAIDALGISRAHFQRNLRSARARIAALWVAPETPRDLSPGTSDTECRYGHPLEGDNLYISSEGRRRCRTCRRRDSTAGTRRRKARAA